MNKKVAQFKLHVLIFKIYVYSIKKISLEGDRKFSELKGDGEGFGLLGGSSVSH